MFIIVLTGNVLICDIVGQEEFGMIVNEICVKLEQRLRDVDLSSILFGILI